MAGAKNVYVSVRRDSCPLGRSGCLYVLKRSAASGRQGLRKSGPQPMKLGACPVSKVPGPRRSNDAFLAGLLANDSWMVVAFSDGHVLMAVGDLLEMQTEHLAGAPTTSSIRRTMAKSRSRERLSGSADTSASPIGRGSRDRRRTAFGLSGISSAYTRILRTRSGR